MQTHTFSTTSQGVWALEKTDVIKPLVRYVLHPDSELDPSPAQLLFDVTNCLLTGKCVGILADGASTQTLSRLSEIWRDGRVLRRTEQSVFVCIEPRFTSNGLKNQYVSGTVCFHFSLFSQQMPEDMMFRSLLHPHPDAPLRLDVNACTGEIALVVHTDFVSESDLLTALQSAASQSGRSLRYSA